MNIFSSPKISIILASFNHAKFVREAVESVLAQTMRELELIVVDDGSTDGTLDEVAKIQDKRLKLVRLAPNRRYHPRNTGIAMARGKYIAFQNSDDVWSPNKLEKQLEVFRKNKEVVLCFSRINIINKKGEIIPRSWAHGNLAGENKNNGDWLAELFVAGKNFGIMSAVLRKDKLYKLGGRFCESMVQMSDYDLWVRMLGLGQIYIVEETLASMRLVEGANLSSPRPDVFIRCIYEAVDILDRYTQWPINQYLQSIFPSVIPQGKISLSIQYAALAKYAWQLGTPHHALFADRVIARLLTNLKDRKEVLDFYGPDLVQEYIKRRGKIEVQINQ